MALDVHVIPGYVLVTCDRETVVVAGVLVPPPGGTPPAASLSLTGGDSTSWLPYEGPQIPPPTGPGRHGISSQIVNLAVPGMHVGSLESIIRPALDGLLVSKSFGEFAQTMRGGYYALTVAPEFTADADKQSAQISDRSPSVLMMRWPPNA